MKGAHEKKLRLAADRNDAVEGQKAAEEALRLARTDDAEKDRRIRQGELEKERLELDARAISVRRELDSLKSAREAHSHREKAELDHAVAAAERKRLEVELEAARGRKTVTDHQLDVLEISARLQAQRRVRDEIEMLRNVRGQFEADRASIREQRDQAAALEATIPAGLPTPDGLTALRRLRDALSLAEAKLGVGIAVAVDRLGKKVAIQVRVDDAESDVPSEGAFRIEGERAVDLRVGDLAKLSITVGTKEARAEAEELANRWTAESAPIFASAEVTSLEALAERTTEAGEIRRRVVELRNAASGIAQRIPGYEMQLSRHPGLVHESAELDRALDGAPTVEAERLLAELGQGSLQDRRVKLTAERSSTVTYLEVTTSAVRIADQELSKLDERLVAAVRNAELLGMKLPEAGWAQETRRLDAEREAIERRQATLLADLSSLTAERDQEVVKAEAAVHASRVALQTLTDSLHLSATAVENLLAESSRLEGVIQTRRPQVEQLDLDAARRRVHDSAVALDALARPARPVRDDEIAAAVHDVTRTTLRYETARDEARKAEGALQTVGGQVVREEEENAKEALRVAEQKERDVELDYDSWRLLADKLREAETNEGQHLGEALAGPISERFADLTGGLYGKLEMTPQLETKGVRAAGALRPTTSLSLGTQEQLATLLRLTIAEHLECFLILDDHLTQTDPARSKWFVDVLRAHADKAQIVVLTCRPLDYLREADLVAGAINATLAGGLVRVVDLSGAITRC